MAPPGQRAALNPSAMLAALLNKRDKLQQELQSVEKQVYELETGYLQDSNQFGNVLRGFEGFLSSSKNTLNLKRSRKFQPEDRIFSLSSVTSPAVEEHISWNDDGRIEYGPSWLKGGSAPASGQGKPKKRGRIALREGKKIQPPTEEDIKEEDDHDLILR